MPEQACTRRERRPLSTSARLYEQRRSLPRTSSRRRSWAAALARSWSACAVAAEAWPRAAASSRSSSARGHALAEQMLQTGHACSPRVVMMRRSRSAAAACSSLTCAAAAAFAAFMRAASSRAAAASCFALASSRSRPARAQQSVPGASERTTQTAEAMRESGDSGTQGHGTRRPGTTETHTPPHLSSRRGGGRAQQRLSSTPLLARPAGSLPRPSRPPHRASRWPGCVQGLCTSSALSSPSERASARRRQ